MKRLNWFEKLFIAISFLFVGYMMVGCPMVAHGANTNTNSIVTPAAPQTFIERVGGTNLNDCVVDILRGAKSAGSEIYAASKQAITKAVDFTVEQAPLVVKEFIHWQIAKSIVWIAIWGTVAILLFYLAHRLIKWGGEAECFGWFVRIVAGIMLVITLGINGMRITKVCVAPRVFLIEYVVDTVQHHGHSHCD